MQKRIQIQLELYDLMVEYIREHCDYEDFNRYQRIMRGIEAKQEAMIRHNVYTIYKSSENNQTRETARQIYLEKAGIRQDLTW